LKSSHELASVNDNFHDWLNKIYSNKKIGTVKAVCGKVHKYLGMTLDYSKNKVLHVHMKSYIELMLKEFPCELGNKNEKYPWNQNLFKTLDTHNEKLLGNKKTEIFHTCVTKGLFLAKQGRPDIMPGIAYLSTKVRNPSRNNGDKLTNLLRFLKNTKNDTLWLSMEDNCIVKWYLETSFAVHKDMKSHTGSVLTLGEGVLQAISTIQRTNTRSSTEAELISFDDIVSKVLWTRLFLKEQGYTVSENVIYRDNQAAMKLEIHGKAVREREHDISILNSFS
jgi:hypothetical protein